MSHPVGLAQILEESGFAEFVAEFMISFFHSYGFGGDYMALLESWSAKELPKKLPTS
jgi:hypothetical protein